MPATAVVSRRLRALPHRITLIPGDGIGPEVTDAACRVLEASGAALEWEVRSIGLAAVDEGKEPLPTTALESIERNRVALKGPVSTPVTGGFRSANVGLRRALGLFTQIRPCRSFSGVSSRYDDIDLVVMRETTEDLYAGIEFEAGADLTVDLLRWLGDRGVSITAGSGISLKPTSEGAVRRMLHVAFDYVRRNGRRRITVVHKASVMRYTDGMFLAVAREMSQENPDIELDDRLVDNLVAQLVQGPEDFDVLVMPNLYGDIVSDLAAGLVGSVGLAPGANLGSQVAVFEPAHGTAPKHAGKNDVNPVATMLSGVLMLRHLGEVHAADVVETAITDVISEGRSVTYDLKPGRDGRTAVGTSEMADAVIARMG